MVFHGCKAAQGSPRQPKAVRQPKAALRQQGSPKPQGTGAIRGRSAGDSCTGGTAARTWLCVFSNISMMTALKRLMRMMVTMMMYVTKYGIATTDPHDPATAGLHAWLY
eukprot:355308-Chlamydomonas_euryale.AAC.4